MSDTRTSKKLCRHELDFQMCVRCLREEVARLQSRQEIWSALADGSAPPPEPPAARPSKELPGVCRHGVKISDRCFECQMEATQPQPAPSKEQLADEFLAKAEAEAGRLSHEKPHPRDYGGVVVECANGPRWTLPDEIQRGLYYLHLCQYWRWRAVSAHEPAVDEHAYATKQELLNAGAAHARYRRYYYDVLHNLLEDETASADAMRNAIAMALDGDDAVEQSAQPPSPEPAWISVEERLPKDGDRVIYAFNGRSYQGEYLGCNNEDSLPCFAGAAGWLTGDVMFWLPWPEAPASTRLTKHPEQVKP